jgi:hypothetical protein
LRSGNNLQIDVLGTSSQVTIDNWLGSSSNQLQEITAGGLLHRRLCRPTSSFKADGPLEGHLVE